MALYVGWRHNWQCSSNSLVVVSRTGAARGWARTELWSGAVSSLVGLASRAKALHVGKHVQAAMDSGVRVRGGWALCRGGTVVHWVAWITGGGTGGSTPGGAGLGGSGPGGGPFGVAGLGGGSDGMCCVVGSFVGGTPGRGI